MLEEDVRNEIYTTKEVSSKELCVDTPGGTTHNDDGCPYVHPTYAICDTHKFNAGYDANQSLSDSEMTIVKQTVGLKVTVISQQMYKQYEYLSATIKRLQTQLEKSVLLANLEAAGAKSDGSTSLLGGSGSSSTTVDKSTPLIGRGAEDCSMAGDFDKFSNCEMSNLKAIKESAAMPSSKTNACKQLQIDISNIDSYITMELSAPDWKKCGDYKDKDGKQCASGNNDKDKIINCVNEAIRALNSTSRQLKNQENAGKFQLIMPDQ